MMNTARFYCALVENGDLLDGNWDLIDRPLVDGYQSHRNIANHVDGERNRS